MRSAHTLAGTCVVAGVLVLAKVARADVCVEIDTQHDNLADAERASNMPRLKRAFEANGQKVATTDCTATYRVYHVRQGSTLTVVLGGPSDGRTMQVARIEELPDAYNQMVRSLLTGQPMPASQGATASASGTASVSGGVAVASPGIGAGGTAASPAPESSDSDMLWYLRLGGGAVEQKGLSGGPSFGFGFRHAFGNAALDASLFNFVLTKQDATFDNLTGSWVKVGLVYYLAPRSSRSVYGGAGVGWGVTSSTVDGIHYGNSGVDFGLSLGFEMMRARSFRLFIQADADLPTYSSHGDVPTQSGFVVQLTRNSIYTPSFGLSLGLGFAKPRASPRAQ